VEDTAAEAAVEALEAVAEAASEAVALAEAASADIAVAVALAEDPVPADLADLIIIPHIITIPTDISGAPVGVGAGGGDPDAVITAPVDVPVAWYRQ